MQRLSAFTVRTPFSDVTNFLVLNYASRFSPVSWALFLLFCTARPQAPGGNTKNKKIIKLEIMNLGKWKIVGGETGGVSRRREEKKRGV